MTRQTMATGSSIEGMEMPYGPNRSTGHKQPMSNNFVNRSLQGGMPTQADTMSVNPHGAYHPTLGASTGDGHGADTIQPGVANIADINDPNGVSLTNLLTNIKV